jgi:cytochrome c-type biogenesis protein CcmF
VGPPYFEAVFVPIMVPAIFLMGVGPVARWKQASLPELAGRLRWALAASGVAALLLPLGLPADRRAWSPLSTFALLLAAWAVASAMLHAWQRLASVKGGWLERAGRQPRGWYGMLVAHAGIGVFIFGATMANGFESKQELKLQVGDDVTMAGYAFRLQGIAPSKGPNFEALRATVLVTRNGAAEATLHPEKRIYRAQQMPLSQASLDVGVTRDLFVALGEPAGEQAWTLRLHVKPFMAWVWVGCLLMAFGGLLAASDRRYRMGVAARRTAGIGGAAVGGAVAFGRQEGL